MNDDVFTIVYTIAPRKYGPRTRYVLVDEKRRTLRLAGNNGVRHVVYFESIDEARAYAENRNCTIAE